MAVKIADIQKLREMTGAGMMDCKNALTESNCDFDEAVKIIREKGQLVAAKRGDREASEGCVLSETKDGFAAIIALQCETDFVATNADFVALAQLILDQAMSNKPAGLEELKSLKVDGRTIQELVTDRSGVTGEKVELGFYEFVKDAYVVSYVHPGNKLASVVSFNKEIDYQASREVAMQVAAMNPVALNRDSVPEDVVAKEFEIAREKARQEGKPEAMLDKIATGRLNKFYKESTLMEQEFIKESKMTVKQYLASVDKDADITSFKRVSLNDE